MYSENSMNFYGKKNLFLPDKIHESKEIFIGIDPSIANTGIVGLNEKGELCFAVNMKYAMTHFFNGAIHKDHYINRLFAILFIYKDILLKLNGVKVYVTMEDYAYSATGLITRLAELGGLIKMMNFTSNIPTIIVPIPSVKKFATGRGTSTKELIMQQVKKTSPQLQNKLTSDVADAFFIAYICYTYYNNRLLEDKPIKEDALNKFTVINNLRNIKHHKLNIQREFQGDYYA